MPIAHLPSRNSARDAPHPLRIASFRKIPDDLGMFRESWRWVDLSRISLLQSDTLNSPHASQDHREGLGSQMRSSCRKCLWESILSPSPHCSRLHYRSSPHSETEFGDMECPTRPYSFCAHCCSSSQLLLVLVCVTIDDHFPARHEAGIVQISLCYAPHTVSKEHRKLVLFLRASVHLVKTHHPIHSYLIR